VLLVPGKVSETMPYDLLYTRSQEGLAKILPFAEDLKIYIGIENVWNKFLLSPLEMARYIDELNSPYAGVYFDVGNVMIWGFPEQWIRILGSRILISLLKERFSDTIMGGLSSESRIKHV
jgi:hexulose-6-phosphate isomerase